MIENLPYYFTSGILGIMIFFSFAVAPITFTVLDENNARKYIRKIFPFYYLVNLFLSICTLVAFGLNDINFDFYLILAVATLFVISNFILMPLINKYRDNKEDKKFNYLHRFSVIINFIQLIILILILF